MGFLSFIFFGFVSICAIVAFFRSGKIVFRIINSAFDKIEERFC